MARKPRGLDDDLFDTPVAEVKEAKPDSPPAKPITKAKDSTEPKRTVTPQPIKSPGDIPAPVLPEVEDVPKHATLTFAQVCGVRNIVMALDESANCPLRYLIGHLATNLRGLAYAMEKNGVTELKC